jgi:hypothetical protein
MPEFYRLPVRGPFSLRAAAEFGFGPNEGSSEPFDGALRLAFPVCPGWVRSTPD